jgi:hypothetical protein
MLLLFTLIPMISAVLDLSAAVANLAMTVINRRRTTRDTANNDITRQPRVKSVPTPGMDVDSDATSARPAPPSQPDFVLTVRIWGVRASIGPD